MYTVLLEELIEKQIVTVLTYVNMKVIFAVMNTT